MDENNRIESSEEQDDDENPVDLPSATIIGANIAAVNTGSFPGAVVAPAANIAAEEAEEEEAEEEAEAAEAGEEGNV